jgi:hypothetical protein
MVSWRIKLLYLAVAAALAASVGADALGWTWA